MTRRLLLLTLSLSTGLAAGVVAAGSPASADVPARTAQSLPCDAIEPAVSDQSPRWSDDAGWNQESRFLTIQLADIDGDGRSELLGRSGDGMVANRFDRATGMWIPLAPPQDINSDARGFTEPRYYATIQFAEVDDRPGAEMIARGGSGLVTFTWDATSRQWTVVGNPDGVEDLSDAEGFSDPGGWSTIRLADIDGDDRAELIARQPGPLGGMEAWKWSSTGWVLFASEGTNSDANHWGDPSHYATLRFADVDGIPGAEMVGRGTEGIETRTWSTGLRRWVELDLSGIAKSWTTPDKFRTIQLADLDGNGRAELLGRGGAGIEQFEWNVASKRWDRLGVVGGLALSDGAGWEDPSLYSTIQFADVTGGKGVELIARGHSGLFVASYGSGGWQQPTEWLTVPSMSDAGGWQLPEAYTTIQAADIAGDGKAEIIGRSSQGVETWTYDKARRAFTSPVTRGFPEFTGDELEAYQWIGQNRFGLKRTRDIRGQYDNATYTSTYWVDAAQWLHDNGTQPPAGLDVSVPAWSTVARQLEMEFSYVEAAWTWFANVDDFLGQVFDEKILTVASVASTIDLPADDPSEVSLDAAGMVFEIGAAIASLGGEAGEAAALVMDVIHVGIEASELAAGKPPDIRAEVVELQDALQAWNTRARDGNACVRQVVLGHWGLLKAMGEPIVENDISWPDTLTRTMVDRARREYEISLWQALSPTKWTVVGSPAYDESVCWDDYPAPPDVFFRYPTDANGNALYYQRPSFEHWEQQNFGSALMVVDRKCNQAPPQEALNKLFLPSAPDGTGPLGVPLEDPHCGLDGWNIPGSDKINPYCEHPWRRSTAAGVATLASAAGVATLASAPQVGLGTRANRRAMRHLEALTATVRTRHAARRGRVLAHLRHTSRLLERARRFRGPHFVGMADATLRRVAAQIRPRSLRGRVHSIRELLIGRRGDPPRVTIARAAASEDERLVSARVRCPAEATGRCAGYVQLRQSGRSLGRRHFVLRAGGVRTLRVRLSRAASGRGMLLRVTTTHLSGNRTVTTRRISLVGANRPTACAAAASAAC